MAQKEDKASQKSSPPSDAQPTARSGELDHIRDILFGNQAREVETRLGELEASVTAVRRDLLEQINRQVTAASEQSAAQLAETRKALSAQLQRQDESQTTQLQQTRQTLSEQQHDQAQKQAQQLNETHAQLAERLDQQTADLQKQIREMRRELSDSMHRLHDELAQRLLAVQAELRQRDDDLRQELLAVSAWLDDRKTTRVDLGQMLIDLGGRLQAARGEEAADEPEA